MNLVNLLKDQVTAGLAGQAAKFLGESESGVTKALDGVFPSLLGKVIDMSEDSNGLQDIFKMASNADTGILDNMGDLFSSTSKVTNLMNGGGGLLSTLLGNNMGGFIEKIAGFGGLKTGSSSSLIKMAAPFLMSMVGRYVKNKALDAVGLGKFLGSQRGHVSSAMPRGLGNVLGLRGLGDLVSGVADGGKKVVGGVGDAGKRVVGGAADLAGRGVDAAGDVGGAAVKTGGSILRWLLPLFLLLMALGYFFGMKTGCGAIDSTVDKATDMTESTVKGAGELAGDAAGAVADGVGAVADGVGSVFGKVDDVAKAALDKISFTAGSVGDQMTKFIDGGFKGDARFRFNNLNFATGSAEISGQSGKEVDNLAAILKAYPGLNISIDGYTDNTGDAAKNVELSKMRANAVQARLIASGIGGDRISTRGLGSADPVASNDTADGRAQNRRIEVTLAK